MKGARAIDDTGKRYGALVAVADVGSDKNRRVWRYLCDCGEHVERVRVCVVNVARRGGVPNCGCKTKEIRADNGRGNRTHGLSQIKLYDVWRQMLRRCSDTDCKDYPLYGARGIAVCEEWSDLATFVDWALSSGG